jgi:hypothetical protein
MLPDGVTEPTVLYRAILHLVYLRVVGFEWLDWSHGSEETSSNMKKDFLIYDRFFDRL